MPRTFDVIHLGSALDGFGNPIFIDTPNGNSDAENASVLIGRTFGSPTDRLSKRIMEFSEVNSNADGVSGRYNQNHDVDTFSVDGVTKTFSGIANFNLTITYNDGTTASASNVKIFQDTSGAIYMAPEMSSTATHFVLSSKSIQSVSFQSIADNTNLHLNANRMADAFACFTCGTRIGVGDTEEKIENLGRHDLVCTTAGEMVAIRWIGSKKFTAQDLERNPKLRPVRISAGALGRGLPVRDLLVSQQHRVVIASKISKRMFDTDQTLVAAVHLTDLPGISIETDTREVEYFHLLFDQHEIIFAEGAPTESLLASHGGLDLLGCEAAAEILTIFPEFAQQGKSPAAACYVPEVKQQKKLVRRHVKNRQPCLTRWA